MQITILEYDPAWPRAFQRIKEELMTALDTIPIISIEHVGSTSVPGLAAKPIIDMDIIVEPKYLPASCSALSTNGYTYNPEPGGIDRMSFRYNKHTHDSGATRPTEDGEIRRAVYVNIPDGVALKNHLVVRKVLSECPELVLEYAEVKRNLAKQPFESIGKYGGAKNAILQKVLSKGDFEDDEVVAIRLFNGVRNTGT